MTTFRRGARGAAALTTALVLVGCGVAPTATDQPDLSDGDVTISVAWWGADDRTQRTLEAIEIFEEEYPNITVESQYSDWTGYWDRLATTTAGGDMPDVMQFDEMYLASYAQRGTLLDLSTVSNVLDVSALDDTVLHTGSVDNTLYAVPTGAAPNAVIVNTTVFDEHGVDLPDFGNWTWDDYHAIGDELREASGGELKPLGPLCFDNFSLTVWLRQNGEELFDEEGGIAASPETIGACWQMVLDWMETDATDNAEEIAESDGVPLDQTGISLGSTAIGFIPGGIFTAHQASGPQFDFILADWPRDPDMVEDFHYLKPSMYWSGSSTSDHPAEAALLIDFLTNDTRVAELFELDRGLPPNPAFQEAIEPNLDEGGAMSLEFSDQIADRIGDAPAITPSGGSEIATIQTRYAHQAMFGELTPEEAAEQLIAALQRSIDEAS